MIGNGDGVYMAAFKGFKNLINMRAMVKLGISIVKLIFITLIVVLYLKGKLESFATIRWCWSTQIAILISKICFAVIIRICIGLLIIAGIDVFFQKWKFTQDQKMTKQEVKQETKDTDGSPEVKARIRRIQMQMATRKLTEEVPKANVILVNPTHYAVALKYDPKTMQAPELLAKGADHIAEKIREIARSYGVPIIRRPELTRSIFSTVDVGKAIPDNLYMAVAEVMALIHKLKHRR